MKKIVIGNWKMNPHKTKDAIKLHAALSKGVKGIKQVTTVFTPPYPYLPLVKGSASLALGAQNVDVGSGPLTGGVSLAMLTDLKVTYVIVGHSERRARGETDAHTREKVNGIIASKMNVVLCVGEKERDHGGKYLGEVESQLTTALTDVSRSQLANIIIAYEPVWAISKGDGKGQTATPEHAHEMKLFIQKILVGKYGRAAALRVPVLYGGSVNKENVSELLRGEVDGFLVGGASLIPDAFISILKTTSAYARNS